MPDVLVKGLAFIIGVDLLLDRVRALEILLFLKNADMI